ncbi:MAG: C40 family peptidase [Candidatus Niyogibacteria bacterium]|nr:C40 family peptidase [Candidatus Niyogibacteria bacterium]
MTKQEKIQKLIKAANDLIGTPYEYGAYLEKLSAKKPKAVDCSSFIRHIFSRIGIELPRSSILQAARGKEIKNPVDLLAGDLLFFEGVKGHYSHRLFRGRKIYIGHAAFYAGNNEIIHARESKKSVTKQKLSSLVKKKHFDIKLIKRIIS